MKKVVLSVLVFAVFFGCVAVNFSLVAKNKHTSTESSDKGVEYIEKLEKRSIDSVQKDIDKAEKKRIAAKTELNKKEAAKKSVKLIEQGKRSYIQAFRNVYIAGDSLMHGLSEYGIINSSHLVTQVSASLGHLSENFGKIVGMRPPILILHYGLNMCSANTGADTHFINQYTSLIEKFKKELPETRIIISLIFPVDNSVTKRINNKTIEKYNKRMIEMCKKEKIEYLDSSSVFKNHPECYEPDGIHQKKMFYNNYWLKFVMTEKGIY